MCAHTDKKCLSLCALERKRQHVSSRNDTENDSSTRSTVHLFSYSIIHYPFRLSVSDPFVNCGVA